MKNLCLGLFVCLLGIEYSYGALQIYREMQNHCINEGGYCINTLLPPPPRPRRPPRRRTQRRRGMPRTKTRKGRRKVGPGAPVRRPGPPAGPAAIPPYEAPHQQTWNQPSQRQQPNNNNFFSNPLAWMFFNTRKKRQAPAEPPEAGEIPQRIPGQTVMSFLNTNCLKAEPDFSCMKTGGWCCRPHP